MAALARRVLRAGASVTARARSAAADRSVRREASRVLPAWGVGRHRVVRNLGGTGRSSWLTEIDGRPYVLRRLVGWQDYVDYQIRALSRLAEAGFAYETPRLAPTAAGRPFHEEGEVRWLLYPFLSGTHPARAGYARRAREVGALAGAFHAAIGTVDPGGTAGAAGGAAGGVAGGVAGGARVGDTGGGTGRFRLPLFDTGFVGRHLAAAGDLGPAVARALARHEAVAARAGAALAALPRQTVYNDWHPGNLVERDGRITGLIDFDSIAEAPRIVDVQNALAYLLLEDGEREATVAAFLDGYRSAPGCSAPGRSDLGRSAPGRSVPEIGDRELALLWPLMTDRLLWLIADLAREKAAGLPARDDLARALAGLLAWVVEREDAAA